MAGKSGKISKTSRAAVNAGAKTAGGSTDSAWLIPLNSGQHAYIRVAGKTLRLATDSDEFVAAVAALTEAGSGARIRENLDELAVTYPDNGWDATIARLEGAKAFGPAEAA